jgi:DNA-binding beta-propeller fold protein YncE
LYITNYNSDPSSTSFVSAIDDSTNSIINTVPTGGSGASGITFNPENGNLYVTNWYSQTVSIIFTGNFLQQQQQPLQQQQQQPLQQQQQQPLQQQQQ